MDSSTAPDKAVEHILGKPHKTLLFNDELHEMNEVAMQICKAIHCAREEAVRIMLLAHKTGSAVVVVAHREKCEHVAAVLEEIRLSTKVEPA
jgi:ATP-dependent Clp protease adapter protein ClpS